MQIRVLAVGLLGTVMAFGQGVGQTGWMTCSTATSCTNMTTTSGTSTIVWMQDGTATFGGAETRKPKVPMPTLLSVKAKAKPVNGAMLANSDYLQLAAKIGLSSAATDETKLLRSINGHGYKVFDFPSVDEYLYNMALKQGANMRWVWKPMRKKDIDSIHTIETRVGANSGIVSSWSLYAHAIPMRILEDVACLLEDVPELIALVSDYEVVRPDPFLAVTTPKLLEAGRIYIIDVWNEPGFTEKDDSKQVAPAARTLASR